MLTHAQWRNKLSSAGFTLLELLVVLSIAALLLTLTGPKFSTLHQTTDHLRLSHQLTNALKLAHIQAQEEGRIIRVIATPEEHTLLIDEHSAFSWPENYRLIFLTTDEEEQETGSVLFLPNGGSSGARLRLIETDSLHQRQLEISINRLTGGLQHVTI